MITDWMKEIDAAITICDKNFNIVYMNDKSKKTFTSVELGDSILFCHSQISINLMKELLEHGKTNTYTIEKTVENKPIKKLIHQTPWYKNRKIAGLIEFSIILPNDIKHFVRS